MRRCIAKCLVILLQTLSGYEKGQCNCCKSLKEGPGFTDTVREFHENCEVPTPLTSGSSTLALRTSLPPLMDRVSLWVI